MTAIVVGATGLVGTHLVEQLIDNNNYKKVLVLTRSPLEKQHEKLEVHIIDFNKPEEWKHFLKGDVLFSTLGTTLRKAGNKDAQFLIDYTYQYHCAKAAAENKVPQYVLVSAAYASPNSKIFYSRMKGILERDIATLPFNNISIVKPGVIAGERKEQRTAERISITLFNLLHRIPGLQFTKPIHASIIAKAMINATNHHPERLNTYELGEVFKLSETIS